MGRQEHSNSAACTPMSLKPVLTSGEGIQTLAASGMYSHPSWEEKGATLSLNYIVRHIIMNVQIISSFRSSTACPERSSSPASLRLVHCWPPAGG